MHDCYIASGWFNENQARDLENIKTALDELGVNYFSPKDEIVAKPDASPEEQEMIFKGNVDAITGGNFVVCNTRDKDLGTIFEAGFLTHQMFQSFIMLKDCKVTLILCFHVVEELLQLTLKN